MTLDDPRHGSYAGASQHWKAGEPLCDPCASAAARRRKVNRVLRATGRAKMVPAVGTVRRIRALRCLGWTVEDIARETGVPAKTLRNPCHRGQYVHRDTFNAVSRAYERLCMTQPEGGYHVRARRHAVSMGWLPPLAWIDIDDPTEDPTARMSEEERWVQWWESRGYTDADHSAVERILAGDWKLSCTPADKAAVIARWDRGTNELERLTGWKIERYSSRPELVA
jgi:hypothetical protein